jgi:hypothetical protein
MYDRYSPEIDIEQRSLKATGEPMLMSARRQAITDVIITE